MSKKVALMCGHGKSANGSWDAGTTYGGYSEAALMLPITKAAVEYLRDRGVTVISDADTGNDKNMIVDVQWANKQKCDIYVSIHCDWYKAPTGVMPLYVSASGKKLATALNTAVQKGMNMKSRGVTKRTELYELNGTNMPSCILETGSIKADLKTLKDRPNTYGKVIADGICDYLGVAKTSKSASQTAKSAEKSQKTASNNNKQTSNNNKQTTWQDKAVAYGRNLAKKKFRYIGYNQQKCCGICGKNAKFGSNCIGTVGAILHHGGGLKVKCTASGLINDALGTKMLKASAKEALKMWEERNGDGWAVISNDDKAIPASKLKKADVLIYYSGKTYKHTALYAGSGKIIDNRSSGGCGVRSYAISGLSCKLAFRYVGK